MTVFSMLSKLPTPSPGKTGWPWSEETLQFSERMQNGGKWPKISIITPSYNQGQFLEETIRSVLLQNYPNLEYIIIDGGSTDNSVETIKKYEPWLSYWISEPDDGQSHAINKGLTLATGDIIAWVNSDDFYLPSAFYKITEKFPFNDETVFGTATAVEFLDEETGHRSNRYQKYYSSLAELIPEENYIHTAGIFWKRKIIDEIGLMDVNLHYGFDKEFWIRMISKGYLYSIDNTIVSCVYRFHDHSKSVSSRLAFKYEWAKIGLAYATKANLGHTELNNLKQQLVYSAVRLAQNKKLTRMACAKYLISALRYDLSALIRRDFVGTLFNLCFRY